MASSMQLGIFVQGIVSSSASVVYTVPADNTMVLKTISLCNFTNDTDAVSIWLLPPGESSVADQYMVVNALSVEASDTQLLNLDMYPSAGYKICMKGEQGSKVALTISGVLLSATSGE